MICILKVIDGPAQGAQLWISRNQCLVIGRRSTADFSVPTDPHMSRNHLFVEGNESSFRVRDAGSSNGTFVNNAPVAVAQLCSGDLIRAGKSVFQVTLKEEAMKDQPPGLSASRQVPELPTRKLAADNGDDYTEKLDYPA